MHYELCQLGDPKKAVDRGRFALCDSAIEFAAKRGLACLVVRVDSYERTVRAFAEDGTVLWAKPCAQCDGTGTIYNGNMYCDECAGLGATRDREKDPAHRAKRIVPRTPVRVETWPAKARWP